MESICHTRIAIYLIRRDLKAHFDNFGQENTVYWLDDEERYRSEEGYLHKLAFFSDNNACLRRDVLGEISVSGCGFCRRSDMDAQND